HRGGPRGHARRGADGRRDGAVGLRARLRRAGDRVARRRRREDGPRSRHRHDARHTDRAGRGPARARELPASRRAEGHGVLPGRHLDRRRARPGGGRHPAHLHEGRGTRDPALARAGTGPRLMFVASNFVLAIARLLEIVLWAYFWMIIARAVLSWV